MQKSIGLFLISVICILTILITGCTNPASNATAMITPAPATTATVVVTATTTAPVQTVAPASVVTTPPPTATPDPGFETKGSVNKMYYYIIDGIPGYIPTKVYTGVNDYITSFGNIYTGDDYNAIIRNG